MADLGPELFARDDREEKGLVGHYEVSFTAERRGEAHHRLLHFRGVRTAPEQQTSNVKRLVGHIFYGRRRHFD